MSIEVDVQYVCERNECPADADMQHWAQAAAEGCQDGTEMVIRIVDEAEAAALNREYRHKTGATNVLSFPFKPVAEVDVQHLGDLVICAPVVEREAHEQDKPVRAHWAHMVVHGVLHLRGYDHLSPDEASVMESREQEILASLGFPDPYDVSGK